MHGHSSERPGMHDNAEAEQNSLAQAERTRPGVFLSSRGRRTRRGFLNVMVRHHLYLDRARDLGTESCIAVHSKSLNSARRRTRRTRPRGVAATQRWGGGWYVASP